MQNAKTTKHPIYPAIPVAVPSIALATHPGLFPQLDAILAVTQRVTLIQKQCCCHPSEFPRLK
jgi:hypothetical protein